MTEMIIKMSIMTLIYVGVTFLIWKQAGGKKIPLDNKIAVGFLYGIMCIFSTHLGIDYGEMLVNVRDLGPLCAGLFFDPVSGIIAGVIGGVERYIAGTQFGVGAFTSVACSVSTTLAGFLAAFLRIFIFKHKRPSAAYAFFMGDFVEVFHMYAVFLTHRNELNKAYLVVKTCAVPMILFCAVGLSLVAFAVNISAGEWHNPLKPIPYKDIPVSNRFQVWLFGVTVVVLLLSFQFSYTMHTREAILESGWDLEYTSEDITFAFTHIRARGGSAEGFQHHVGYYGTFCIIDEDDNVLAGTDFDKYYTPELGQLMKNHETDVSFRETIYDEESLCYIHKPSDDTYLFLQMPMSEVFQMRDVKAYETFLADILIFTIIYILVSMLVEELVVKNLQKVNESLGRITEGNLDEVVSVYSSYEFAVLSDDINQTVNALKGYIDAAEKRIEQELLLARSIQDSALPKNFVFDHGGFELFAAIDPAREVGGDFYDFFFVDTDKLALVIADVSGKGIPAALFMMRSKTAIRGLAETGDYPKEIFEKVNNELCTGNEINMFVTVWMGIIDLKTGDVKCANAGHEYPAVMHAGGDFELFKDKHHPPLGTMENLRYSEYDMHLDPGDILYVYTDGVPEAINISETQYGTGRMLLVLNEFRDASMEKLLDAVKTDQDVFVGEADQFDDITMLGFKYLDTE